VGAQLAEKKVPSGCCTPTCRSATRTPKAHPNVTRPPQNPSHCQLKNPHTLAKALGLVNVTLVRTPCVVRDLLPQALRQAACQMALDTQDNQREQCQGVGWQTPPQPEGSAVPSFQTPHAPVLALQQRPHHQQKALCGPLLSPRRCCCMADAAANAAMHLRGSSLPAHH
jgi:hypothetical protein